MERRERMDPGQRATGTRDEHYNLISVLYHALHGTENCNTYALDAEAAGDQQLANFFREAGRMQERLAEQTKGMLGIDVAPTTSPEEIAPPDTPTSPGGEQSPRTGGGLPNPSEPPPLV
jgi:hypothetical protein